MKKQLYTLFIILGLGTADALAQQQPLFTQYIFNLATINPAYAGSQQAISLTSMYRVQWVNVPGAPRTLLFSAHSPILKSNSAVGGVVMTDQLGSAFNTSFFALYSYRLLLSKSVSASFGLQFGGDHFSWDVTSLLVTPDQSGQRDPKFEATIPSRFAPNLGLGVYISSKIGFLSFSIPRLLDASVIEDEKESAGTLAPHYYLSGGAILDLMRNIKIKPSFMVRQVTGAPLSIDLSTFFLFFDKYWLGGSYRLEESVSVMANYTVFKELRIGYSYDFILNNASNISSGTHEIMLNYKIFAKTYKRGMLSPRDF